MMLTYARGQHGGFVCGRVMRTSVITAILVLVLSGCIPFQSDEARGPTVGFTASESGVFTIYLQDCIDSPVVSAFGSLPNAKDAGPVVWRAEYPRDPDARSFRLAPADWRSVAGEYSIKEDWIEFELTTKDGMPYGVVWDDYTKKLTVPEGSLITDFGVMKIQDFKTKECPQYES